MHYSCVFMDLRKLTGNSLTHVKTKKEASYRLACWLAEGEELKLKLYFCYDGKLNLDHNP